MKKSKWLLLDGDGCTHVVPETDSQPHGNTKDETGNIVLAGHDCPCKPVIESNGYYGKPTVIHNSFKDKNFLDTVMKELFTS